MPVEANTTLVAHDHDVQNKGSLTPSVILDVDMSNGLDGSFYHGQVTTILKDAIYERSTNFRTVLELQQYLLQVVYLSYSNLFWDTIKVLFLGETYLRFLPHESNTIRSRISQQTFYNLHDFVDCSIAT